MMIRVAQPQDCDAIGALWLRLVAYHEALDPRLPAASEDGALRYARRIESLLMDAYARTLVAESDGQIVGYVTGMVMDMRPDMFVHETTGMIADIYVLDEWRSAGTGSALVSAMEDWFRLRGITSYEWFVFAYNAPARQFWQARGGRDVMIRMHIDLQSPQE